MKKSDKFEWTPEADATFAELKVGIAATGQVVSTVLTVEREEEGKAY